MATLPQQPKGIKAVADTLGVRRRWWQSERTIAGNVVKAMQQRAPLNLLSEAFAEAQEEIAEAQQSARSETLREISEGFVARCNRPAPRHLREESYTEAEGFYSIPVDGQKPDYICREWVFRYSDGDVETVTTRRAVA